MRYVFPLSGGLAKHFDGGYTPVMPLARSGNHPANLVTGGFLLHGRGRVRVGVRRFPLLVILGAAFVLAACRPQPTSTPMGVDTVAVVGTQAISSEQFLAQLARSSSAHPADTRVRQAVLEEMVRFEIFYQRALASGCDKDPEVAAELKRMLVARFQEQELSRLGTPQVSAEEVGEYYARNQARFTTPAKLHAAFIEVKVSRLATPEKRAETAERAALARLQALTTAPEDGSFGLVAQQFSEHQSSRYRGGDIGWVTVGATNAEWPSEVLSALTQLAEPGEVSPIIESAQAFYLVKLLEKQPARVRPLEEVTGGIQYIIRRQKEEEQRNHLIATLKEGLDIRVNQRLLDSLSLPAHNEPRPPETPGVRAQK